jgi:hypothetical protein
MNRGSHDCHEAGASDVILFRAVADKLKCDLAQMEGFQKGIMCKQSGLGFHLPGEE